MSRVECRVDYADTDAMAVMHHAAYFRYLERARLCLMKNIGLDYKIIERSGYMLPLRHAEIDYKRPLYFDDAFVVSVAVKRISLASIELAYEIYRDKELVAQAQTHHAWVRRDESGRLRPVKIAEEWRTLWLKQHKMK